MVWSMDEIVHINHGLDMKFDDVNIHVMSLVTIVVCDLIYITKGMLVTNVDCYN
jgi:hypothetical protein